MCLISTIIPIYNSSDYLERCLDSLLTAQIDEVDNEIILVNDGSTDNSLEICEDYASKHKNIKIFSQENQGLSGARNTGLKAVTGEYISFVDSDDTVEPNYFKVILPYLNQNYNMIHFGYKNISENNTQTHIPIAKTYTKTEIEDLLVNTSKNKALWFVWRRIYKTEFLTEHNISFDKEIKYGEDSVFLMKVLSELNQFKAIDNVLYNYHENKNSLTAQKYKQGLLIKFEIQYFKRKEIKVEGVNNTLIKKDIANNYIEHSLLSLLKNLKNAPEDLDKLNELEKMRHSIIYQECFQCYSYNWKRPKRSLIIKLFELKQFKLLNEILKTNT